MTDSLLIVSELSKVPLGLFSIDRDLRRGFGLCHTPDY